MKNNPRILLSCYTGLGNFILKTPLIKEIDSKLGRSSQIDLLMGSPWGAEKVLEYSDLISSILWLPQNDSWLHKVAFFLKLRKQNYDFVFLPFDSTPGFVLLLSIFFLRSSSIIAHVNVYQPTGRQLLKNAIYSSLFNNLRWVPVLHGRHEIDLNIDLLDSISYDLYSEYRDRHTFVTYNKEEIIDGLPINYIVLQPSARNGVPTPKKWPLVSYEALINIFENTYPDMYFVLVGDSGDLDAINNSTISTKSCVINMIGKTNFSQLCNIIDSAMVVVANDSGVMHVANAIGTPLIALYGPSDHTRTAPLGDKSIMLFSRNDCLCRLYAFRSGEDDTLDYFGNDYCMHNIKPEDVYDSIIKLISPLPPVSG